MKDKAEGNSNAEIQPISVAFSRPVMSSKKSQAKHQAQTAKTEETWAKVRPPLAILSSMLTGFIRNR